MKPRTLRVAALASLITLFGFWVPLVWLLGCGEPVTPDKCSDEYLGELTTLETAELIMACKGVPKDQPCEAAQPIRDKYAALREDWIKCQ